MSADSFLTFQHTGDGQLQVKVTGDWVIGNVTELKDRISGLFGSTDGTRKVVFQCSGLGKLDTSGAWVLYQAARTLEARGFEADLTGFRQAHSRFMDQVVGDFPEYEEAKEPQHRSVLLDQLENIGGWLVYCICHVGQAFSFLLQLLETFFFNLVMPWRFRFGVMVANMYRAGVLAIPIVALLAFLISIVLAYQGATQLARFGAEIFTIDLTAVTLLREMGVMLTAILVAGRSGSGFAAENGTMKLNEEIDAMQTIGLDPFELLVLPRVVALVLMMPLLTLLADVVGLAGGALSAFMLLDMPLGPYLAQVQSAVTPWTFWFGIIKAPVFGFLIATTGTFWGMHVGGSAESVGRLTTVAVVQSIAMVIAADAVFSVLSSSMGL